MNNSKFSLEQFNVLDEFPGLKDRETFLIGLVEKLRRVAASEDWCSLKKELFGETVASLERQLQSEASKKHPDVQELAHINGQLTWARKYADLNTLADSFMGEVTSIKRTYGKTTKEPFGGFDGNAE